MKLNIVAAGLTLALTPLLGGVANVNATAPVRAGVTPQASGRIALTMWGGAGPDIYTVLPDGKGRRRLTYDGRSWDPAWSPDRQRIAYVRQAKNSYRTTIWVMAANGSHKKLLVSLPGSTLQPDWSPNGKRLVLVRTVGKHNQLYVHSLASDQTQQITFADGPKIGPGAEDPVWSPDGEWIAFSRAYRFASGDGTTWPPAAISVIRPDGTDLSVLTGSTVDERSPGWSPNSRRIAYDYGYQGDYRNPATSQGLRIIRLGGQLVADLEQDGFFEPTWSSDGRWIATVKHDLSGGQAPVSKPGLWLRRPSGADTHRILKGQGMISPDWTP